MSFKCVKAEELSDNIFQLIGSDWMLVTAGSPEKYNTMTASWGGAGVLWGKNVCWCVIRPQRYTYEFIEKNGVFTLSFFDEKYKDALNLCGSKSGREINKAEAAGITPIAGELAGTTEFAEARLVLECKKLYYQDIAPKNFVDADIDKWYSEKDYHRMYIGEIVNCKTKAIKCQN